MNAGDQTNSFAWAGELLTRLLEGIDWVVSQPAIMLLLVVIALISLIKYAMG